MGQIFPRSANLIARASLTLLLVGAAVVVVGGLLYINSPGVWGVGQNPDQPIPYYHNVHVAGLGLDCRYCHTTVEMSSFANVPSTQVCMNCHSQILADAPLLQPLRDSWDTGIPLEWSRVHNLPDHVYFSHMAHVNKGVGCETCHGRVDQMGTVSKVNTLKMSWCLDCHRAPEQYVRPLENITTMGYQPAGDQLTVGRQLVAQYNIQSKTDCYTCHR